MIDIHIKNPVLKQRAFIIASILFSGLCWYFSNGLTGDFWYLLWIAPVPILIISFNTSGRQTFIISFISYLIGRLSWFSYLVTVTFLVPAIIITLALPLILALIITITRKVVIKTNCRTSVLVFPVFFTSFEFLLMKFSSDGTAGSIAYSQSNLIPFIQIACLTGILGITFLLTFIPSAIAVSWYYRKQITKLKFIAGITIVILVSVFIFGIIRISEDSEKKSVKVGLAVLDEKLHQISDHIDFQKEKMAGEFYAKEVSRLSAQGAKLIVLPERAININNETESTLINILTDAAKQNNVSIIAGYTNHRNKHAQNSAFVINEEGVVVCDYNKVHLVNGLENQFKAGREIGIFSFCGIQAGTAICKDLDFPDYIRKYGKSNVRILFIPAWDFVEDDWLHSRMAVLRGVENGFSEVRAARQGRLTINDCCGRVTYEANSSNGLKTVLSGIVSYQKRSTFYARYGDWFGISILIAAACFGFIGIRKKS